MAAHVGLGSQNGVVPHVALTPGIWAIASEPSRSVGAAGSRGGPPGLVCQAVSPSRVWSSAPVCHKKAAQVGFVRVLLKVRAALRGRHVLVPRAEKHNPLHRLSEAS